MLTSEEKSFLKDRGFKIIYSDEPLGRKLPYVALGSADPNKPYSGININLNDKVSIDDFLIIHPSTHPNHVKLVGVIEHIAKSLMTEEDYIPVDQPIDVVVFDPAWNPVVKKLVMKHSDRLVDRVLWGAISLGSYLNE